MTTINIKNENGKTIAKLNVRPKPHVATAYEVGAILESSWGYEQTNIDFYCIISRTENTLTVLPMKQKVDSMPAWWMQTKVIPTTVEFDAKPIRRKIYKNRQTGQESGISISCGWCDLWDGKPSHATHYA